MLNETEHPSGTQVVRPGYGYRGRVVGWTTKFGTRFVIVSWNGRTGSTRENPAGLEPARAL